jgi:cytochrome c553
MKNHTPAALALFALLAGCSKSEPSSMASGSAPPASTIWSKELTNDQRTAFMSANVVPAMGPVFQGRDATRYAEFGCKTCHGPANRRPQDFLPKLAMKNGEFVAFTEQPEITKFMAAQVVPKMAAAMGQPPYDPRTHQGFGCLGCHDTIIKD